MKKQILKEEELTKSLITILNIMLKKDFDPEDIEGNYTTLKYELHIKDSELRSESILYYRKYYDVAKERGDFKNLGEVNLDFDPNEVDDEIMALSEFLQIHPLLIDDVGYTTYKNILTDDEYRVLSESDADDEFRSRAEESIEEQLRYGDSGWLTYHITMDKSYIQSYSSEEADYRVDNTYDDDDIIREMDAEDDLEVLLTNAKNKENRYIELEDEIDDVQDKIEEILDEYNDLKEEMNDLESEALESDDQNEIDSLKVEYDEKKEEINKLKNNLDFWKNHLEEINDEFNNMDEPSFNEYKIKEDFADDLRDDLRDKIADELYDQIESEGYQYFVDNFGYSIKEILDYGYFEIDMESAIGGLESDRGSFMSSYDGIENDVVYKGNTWFIYQTN